MDSRSGLCRDVPLPEVSALAHEKPASHSQPLQLPRSRKASFVVCPATLGGWKIPPDLLYLIFNIFSGLAFSHRGARKLFRKRVCARNRLFGPLRERVLPEPGRPCVGCRRLPGMVRLSHRTGGMCNTCCAWRLLNVHFLQFVYQHAASYTA